MKYTLDYCIENRVSIWCKTQAEAQELLAFLEGKGFEWRSGKKLTEETHWHGASRYYLPQPCEELTSSSSLSTTESVLFKFFKQINMQEIIGYKVPYDLFNGNIKKDWILYKDSDGKSYRPKGHGPLSAIPKEIVESWEPVYKRGPFKVGDWVMWDGNISNGPYKLAIINGKKSEDFNGNYRDLADGPYRLATKEEVESHLMKLATEMGFTFGKTFTGVRKVVKDEMVDGIPCTGLSDEKNAAVGSNLYYSFETDTLYTIGYGAHVIYEKGVWAKLSVEKTISVGGKFNVTIKDGKIWHKADDITEFVTQLTSAFPHYHVFSGYSVDMKDVTFSRTGCQHVETNLSDWKVVYDKWKKLSSNPS